jgi:hypothetical protein
LSAGRKSASGSSGCEVSGDYAVQTVHPGTIQLEGDTAVGRAYVAELGRMRDGTSHVNYSLYHDRYQRTPDGWKFTERVYEVIYLDTTPLAARRPTQRGPPTNPVECVKSNYIATAALALHTLSPCEPCDLAGVLQDSEELKTPGPSKPTRHPPDEEDL